MAKDCLKDSHKINTSSLLLNPPLIFCSLSFRRTKWKRQTAVGLELLAEAGNYAAFQRLYGGPPYMGWPYSGQAQHGAPPASAADIYYRQAAAAAALQKPLPYRLYPGVSPLGPLGGMHSPTVPFPHLSAASSLSSLSSYYQTSAVPGATSGSSRSDGEESSATHRITCDVLDSKRSPSPPVNPGSPPGRSEGSSHHSHSDNEDTIQV